MLVLPCMPLLISYPTAEHNHDALQVRIKYFFKEIFQDIFRSDGIIFHSTDFYPTVLCVIVLFPESNW
jgi:hypothetical protein